MATKPPMCPGTLLLGNARSLLDDTAGVLTDGYQRLGPVFRIRAAWRRYTVVAGPATADFMAQGLDKAHLSRERLFGPIAREFGRADLVLKEIGPRHARLRRPLAVAYSRQVASPHVPAMVDAVRHHVRRWRVDRPIGVVAEARQLAFLQYCTLLGTQALAFRDSQLMTTYLMNVAARLLPAIVLRAPWYRRAHARTYGTLTELVRDRRSRIAAERAAVETAAPTLVDALVSVRDPAGAPFTEDEAVSYAAYGLGASIGYVGRLTSFMLYEILRDPALHADLVAEARGAFDCGVRDATDVRRMRLLRSVYDETLRLHSLAIGMAFDVASDFEFLGHQIRQGEALIVSPAPSSYDPANFPDPHRFDAARCREPRNEHRRPGACMPFGVGDRTCAAMGLVELMSMILVATTLHERAVVMAPPHYLLKRFTFPLPSPDRSLRMRAHPHPPPPATPHAQPAAPTAASAALAAASAPVADETSRPVAPPISEEESLAAFPGHDQPAVRDGLIGAPRQSWTAGAVILRQGDPADAFYLLERGSVQVTRAGVGLLATLSEGEWFGEVGLLQRAPRNATVTAGAHGAVARVLGGDAFLGMVAASDLVASEIGQLLRKRAASARWLDVLPRITAPGAALLPEFTRRTYRTGETIVRQGDAAEEFFVLLSGQVVVARRDAAKADQVVATLGPGDYFGEMGLLHGAPRNATVVATGPEDTNTLVTGREGFDRLLAESGGARGELATAMLARAARLS